MAQPKKPAPASNKGGNGKGKTTTIAEREKQQQIARDRRKAEQKRRDSAAARAAVNPNNTEVETEQIFSLSELVDGTARTGNLFEVEGSLFELTLEGGQPAFTLKKGMGDLSTWGDRAPQIFVLLKDLLLEDYTPRLRGEFAEKQGLMWHCVASKMDGDMVDALASRLKREQAEAKAAEAAAAEAARYIGPAEASVWMSAVGDPSKFGDAFESLTASGGVVSLRFGATSDTGVVLDIAYETDGLQIKPIHIGKNCALGGKVLKGTYLWCKAGSLPEERPEIPGDRGEGIALIWSLLMDPAVVDRIKVRDPMMRGMHYAYRRITSQQPVIRLATVSGVPATVAPSAPAPATPQAPVIAQPAVTAKSDADYARTLREAGFTASEVMAALEERAMSAAKHSA